MKTIRCGSWVETLNDKGELHSYNDKPALEFRNGTNYWYKEGKYHRLDGPAVEYSNGDKWWYKEGKRHRIDGPAIEWDNGSKKWYYEGKEIECNSTKEFLKIINLKSFW